MPFSEYAKADYDDSHWSDILIGQAWEDQGYENYDAGGWYRLTPDPSTVEPGSWIPGGISKRVRLVELG